MIKNKHVLHFSLIFLILMLGQKAFAQSNIKIDYFGVISSEIDENMYKMTSDLYYTQLCEIQNFSVTDKRTDAELQNEPSIQSISKDSLGFYAFIEKKVGTGKWISTLIVINQSNGSKKTQKKEYDSYYKILMEPKTVLQDSIKTLIGTNPPEIADASTDPPASSTSDASSATELLSGTWTGEEIIDKIVIMRGGRGFVIFKNGASMNIAINFEDNSNNQIVITQNARANASFYPDIPRQLALREAINAEPIKWIFTLIDNNTLSGTKSTLITDGENVTPGTIQVTWNRKN